MSAPTITEGRFAAIRLILVVAAAVIVLAGLREAQPIAIPFLIATFLTILAARPVQWLAAHRVPTGVAVLLVVVVLLLIMSAVGAIVGTSVNEFTEAIPRYQQRIEATTASLSEWVDSLPFEVPHIEFMDVINPGQIMDLMGRSLKGVVAALSNTLLVVLIMVFMLLEAAGFPAKLEAILGGTTKGALRLAQVTNQVQQYLAIKTAVSVATGLCAGGLVALFGLDFAVVWGVIAFLLNYIPTIGSVIASFPAVLLALVQLGIGPALGIALGYLVINMLFGNLLEPALMGRRLGLSTLVVFLSLVFWGWLWGPVGMLLSVPLTMVAKIFFENSDDLGWVAVLLDSGRAVEARLRAGEPPTRAQPTATGEATSE